MPKTVLVALPDHGYEGYGKPIAVWTDHNQAVHDFALMEKAVVGYRRLALLEVPLVRSKAEPDWKTLYLKLADKVEQILGKALGYPWYKDDQKNFPGATEKDGVCVGDHVPESILAEAAKRIVKENPE